MPVILEAGAFAPWLSGGAGMELLRPAANDVLQKWPVSKRVNSSRAPGDDPTLIERIAVEAGHLSEPVLAL
jgi:putative SOS response-associated peptidase YedK